MSEQFRNAAVIVRSAQFLQSVSGFPLNRTPLVERFQDIVSVVGTYLYQPQSRVHFEPATEEVVPHFEVYRVGDNCTTYIHIHDDRAEVETVLLIGSLSEKVVIFSADLFFATN